MLALPMTIHAFPPGATSSDEGARMLSPPPAPPAGGAEALSATDTGEMRRPPPERGAAAANRGPPLAAANATNPVYRRTDTHWNKLGALVGYNVVVSALGKPEWVIAPARV